MPARPSSAAPTRRLPRLADLRIGVRLGLGLALMTGLLLIVVLLGMRTMAQIQGQLQRVLTISNARIWNANAIGEAAHTAERSLLVMATPALALQREFARIRLLSAWAGLKHSLRELELQESSPQGQGLLLRLRQAAEAARREGETLLAHGQAGAAGPLSAERLQAIHAPLLLLQDICAELVAYEREEADRLNRDARGSYALTRNVFVGLSGLVLITAVLMGVRLTRSIVRPLRQGVQTANALAEGDLALEIPVGRGDETGELLAAMRDMAARLRKAKDLEAQLLQAQKLETVGLLAGGVAHDFNNILTVIAGQAQLGMLKTPARDGNHARFLSIDQAGERAAALIRQLLAFSRKQQLAPRPMSLNATVSDLRKMLGRLIGENIELILALDKGAGHIHADPVQVEQILLNLSVNARDAMPSGGRLTLETRGVEVDAALTGRYVGLAPGPHVLLAVTDTGIGMPPEVRDRIFEPFFTTKEQGKGTGLGLSTVYGIVTQSGGHISVASEPGRGTRFEILFPRLSGAAVVPEATGATVPLPRGQEAVLLVEDEASVRMVIREALVGQGYTVLEAGTGREAMEMRAHYPGRIDVLITDIVMPRMSGVHLAKLLLPELPGACLLFMSGYSEESLADLEGVADVPIRFLQKPFPIPALLQTVRAMLDERGVRWERPADPAGRPALTAIF